MKQGPRLYSNTWMAFVLAVASVLWLGSASTLSGQSGGSSNGRGNGVQESPGRSGDNPGSAVSSQASSHAAQNVPENAGPSKKDTLTITPQTSSGNVSPASPSDEANQWRYLFCLSAGQSFHQTLPVRFQLENTNGTSGQNATILQDAAGRLATDDANFDLVEEFTITDNNDAQTRNVQIDTDTLQDGAYNLNLQIRAWPPRRVHPTHATIHILVLVGSACEETNQTSGSGGSGTSVANIVPTEPSFFTDSEFNPLENCSGQPVSGGTGGTFEIVARPRTETIASTNPGQFYYNLIWTNSEATKPVTINLSAAHLDPQGRNAVHAMVFDSNGFVASFQNWDMTNDDGTACGPSGPCTLTVDAGKKLWVTWHLEFAGKGDSSSSISNTCPGNKTISATGTLKDSSGGTLATGTASATGYLKQ